MATSSDIAAIRGIYLESFPEDERRELGDWERRILSGEISLTTIPGGFMTTWDFGSWCYIEHLAVAPSQRGNGLGSQLLGTVNKPVALEIEIPTSSDQAARRAEFYRRNGFTIHTDFDYTQPAYGPGLRELPMSLVTKGDTPTLEEIAKTLKTRVYQTISPLTALNTKH